MVKPKTYPEKILKKKQEKVKGAEQKPGEMKTQNKKKGHKLSIFSFFKRKKVEHKEGVKKKQKKRNTITQNRRHRLAYYLEKSGFDIDPDMLAKKLFNICIIINLIVTFWVVYYFSTSLGFSWANVFTSIITLWSFIFIALIFGFWAMLYVIIDLKIFKRKNDVENVLPDYLQLTASNIKAGMTIDKALWYAVRPRFGVLAKEIEIVAKETMRGEDLKNALQKFADKYDSVLLKRSVSLLIEGIDAGGEIGDLLNKIAVNIQENKIMRKEMAANVTTYTIFISFAAVVAAPALFALSGVLIQVLSELGGSVGDIPASFVLSFSGSAIEYADFKIFVIVSLIVTSFFSSIIIATIKKGTAKEGLKYIPIFIFISISLFLLGEMILVKMMSLFF